jgi:hypothetical protein
MLSAEILLVYFLILSHLYSTVERCKLIRISYLNKDDSYEVDQLVTYSCKELILSMRLFLRFSGYLYVRQRVEPKAIVWFQFSEFGLLVETECSSMVNAEFVPGGSSEIECS